MILALGATYFVGLVVTAVGVFVCAKWLEDEPAPASHTTFIALTIVAAALWPLLLVGAVELGSMMTYQMLTSRPKDAGLDLDVVRP